MVTPNIGSIYLWLEELWAILCVRDTSLEVSADCRLLTLLSTDETEAWESTCLCLSQLLFKKNLLNDS